MARARDIANIINSAPSIYATEDEAVLRSLVDAKGDLLAGTADNTAGRLAVGTDGNPLVADSAQSTGLKWGGDITIPDKIIHQGDTDTAIRFANDDEVSVETGGTRRVLINNTDTFVRPTGQDTVKFNVTGVLSSMAIGDANGTARGFFQYDRSGGVVLVRSGPSGGVSLGNNSTSWASASDETLKDIKENIKNANEILDSLRTVKFTFKDDEKQQVKLGLIAQDLEKVLPEVVDKNLDETLMVRYTDIIPVLVAALKEQQNQINELIKQQEIKQITNIEIKKSIESKLLTLGLDQEEINLIIGGI
jgi:hypothetical protein